MSRTCSPIALAAEAGRAWIQGQFRMCGNKSLSGRKDREGRSEGRMSQREEEWETTCEQAS